MGRIYCSISSGVIKHGKLGWQAQLSMGIESESGGYLWTLDIDIRYRYILDIDGWIDREIEIEIEIEIDRDRDR